MQSITQNKTKVFMKEQQSRRGCCLSQRKVQQCGNKGVENEKGEQVHLAVKSS